jgi:hypothetical protein
MRGSMAHLAEIYKAGDGFLQRAYPRFGHEKGRTSTMEDRPDFVARVSPKVP